MSRRKILFLLGLSGACIAGWLGFHAEVSSAEAAGMVKDPVKTRLRRIVDPNRDAMAQLDALHHRKASLTAASRAAAWEVIRGFGVEQIKSYLDGLPLKEHWGANSELGCILYYRWGQLDPQAALDSAGAVAGGDTFFVEAVLDGWFGRDPEAAIAWMSDPSRAKSYVGVHTANYLLSADSDPNAALERASAISPKATYGAKQRLAMMASKDEASRQAFFDSIAQEDSGARKRQVDVFARTWVERNPENAISSAFGSQAMPDFVRAATKAQVLQSIQINAAQAPNIWNAMSDDDRQRYGPQFYLNYLNHAPAEAAQWAVDNDQPELLAKTLTNESVPATLFRNPADLMKTMRPTLEAWSRLQPEAADAWLKSLPASVRTPLENPAVKQ